jgi:hypothetical protein
VRNECLFKSVILNGAILSVIDNLTGVSHSLSYLTSVFMCWMRGSGR